MVDRKTGITDEVQIINSSSSTDITDQLGVVQSAGWNIEENINTLPSVGNGANIKEIADGLIVPNVSLSLAVPDFRALQLMGSLSDGTITFDDILPTFTQKMQVGNGTVLEVTGAKYGNVTINLSRDDFITMEFEGVGTSFQFTSDTISTSLTTNEILNWFNGQYKIDGAAVGSVDSCSINYSRNLEPVKGVQSDSSRTPDEIIEKIKEITSDSTIEITDDTAWKKVHDESTLPIDPQDSRGLSNVSIDCGDAGEITVTDGKFTSDEGELANDNEIRTVSTSLQGKEIDVSGIV